MQIYIIVFNKYYIHTLNLWPVIVEMISVVDVFDN